MSEPSITYAEILQDLANTLSDHLTAGFWAFQFICSVAIIGAYYTGNIPADVSPTIKYFVYLLALQLPGVVYYLIKNARREVFG